MKMFLYLYKVRKVNSVTSINPIYNINYAQAPLFKAKDDGVTAPITNPIPAPNIAFRGTEALRAYNYNLVNKENNLDLKLVEPLKIANNIEDVKGERIYNSNGQLIEIVEDKGDFIQVYKPSSFPNEKYQVRLIDKNTNKVLKIQTERQYSAYENTLINVEEFDGNSYYKTGYDKTIKQPQIIGKMIKNNNEEFHVEYDITNKEYCTFLRDKRNSTEKKCRYDNNKNLIKSSVLENMVQKYKDIPKPNLHLKFELNYDPKALEGNKKYYSNGNIEQNIVNKDGKTIIYDFDTQGRLEKITKDNFEIIFFEDNTYNFGEQSITEHLGNNKSITTYFHLDGTTSCSIENNGKGKHYDFNKDGNIIDYNDYTYEEI